MAELSTSKSINSSQLSVELGRIPLRVRPTKTGLLIRTDAIDQATLESKVANHVADPTWVDPNPSGEVLAERDREAQRIQAQKDIDSLAAKVKAGTFDFQKDGLAAIKAVLLKDTTK